MQKFFAVSIRDRAAETFGTPYFVPTEALAVRSFSQEVNRVAENNPLFNHADDFELYVVGTFDDADASFVPEAYEGRVKPRLLCTGKEVKRVVN